MPKEHRQQVLDNARKVGASIVLIVINYFIDPAPLAPKIPVNDLDRDMLLLESLDMILRLK